MPPEFLNIDQTPPHPSASPPGHSDLCPCGPCKNIERKRVYCLGQVPRTSNVGNLFIPTWSVTSSHLRTVVVQISTKERFLYLSTPTNGLGRESIGAEVRMVVF